MWRRMVSGGRLVIGPLYSAALGHKNHGSLCGLRHLRDLKNARRCGISQTLKPVLELIKSFSVPPKKQNGGLLETKDFLAARPSLHFVSSPTRLGRAQSVALW